MTVRTRVTQLAARTAHRTMEKVRSLAFWTLDGLRGGSVRRAYRDLRRLDDAGIPYDEARRELVRSLLSHAITEVPWYSRVPEARLEAFPVINKSVINENYDDFLARPFRDVKLHSMSTSGSTATPFTILQDDGKRKRVSAEAIYFAEIAGYSVGSSLIFPRQINEAFRKSRFAQWLQNETLIEINYYDDEAVAGYLADIVRGSRHGSVLLCYAATADAFRNYFRKHGTGAVSGAQLTGIIAVAERFVSATRREISAAFGCPSYSRYSNQENGILAQETGVSDAFAVNEASYLIEIFDEDEDVRLAPGQTGRIIVTDLYNRAMPMIRYDTGDLGSISVQHDHDGTERMILTDLHGRALDIVADTSGRQISPFRFNDIFDQYPSVLQFQLIQSGATEYHVILNATENEERDVLILRELEDALGRDAEISFEYVPEIPVLASGKRQYIVNEYNRDPDRTDQ